MNALRLEEITLQAVIAKLQAGWSQRIAQINEEKSDEVYCEPPLPESFYIGRMQMLDVFPACFVLPGPTAFREQGAHSMTTRQQVNIWVCERGESGPVLAKRLLRQVRAVIEVLYDDAPQEAAYVANTTTVGPYRLFPKETRPGAVFQQPEGEQPWKGATMIVFTAEQEEL